MLEQLVIPEPIPVKKIAGYGMPEDATNLLTWDFVTEQMIASHYYWISTNYADGRPHAVPVWGVWHENRLHFDGSPKTAWSQNLQRDPRIAVHLPDADKVITIEGLARTIGDNEIDSAAWKVLDSTFQTKYSVDNGSPYWMVHPHKVLAWNGAKLQTMTRWIFASE